MKLISLNELDIGREARISWVDAKKVNPLVLIVGLVEGTKLEVVSKSGDFVEVQFYGTKFAINKFDADNIMVVRS